MSSVALVLTILVVVLFPIGGIIFLLIRRYGEKRVEDVDLSDNPPIVMFLDKPEKEGKGHVFFYKVDHDLVDGGVILVLKPMAFARKNGEIPEEKLKMPPMRVFVPFSRYRPLGKSLQTERELEIVFPSNVDDMDDRWKETPFGMLATDFLRASDTSERTKEVYVNIIDELLGMIEKLHSLDKIPQELLQKINSMRNPEMGQRRKEEEVKL